jgi:hypothetical protein
MKDPGLARAEHGSGDAMFHIHAKRLDVVVCHSPGGRPRDKVSRFTIAHHDDALLGLHDHCRALYEPAQRLLIFADRYRDIVGGCSAP